MYVINLLVFIGLSRKNLIPKSLTSSCLSQYAEHIIIGIFILLSMIYLLN